MAADGAAVSDRRWHVLVGTVPPSRTEFETSRQDEAQDYLTRAYGPVVRTRRRVPGYRLQHTRLDAAAFAIDAVFLTDADFVVEPLGSLMVTRLNSGRIGQTTGGANYRLGAGDVFLLAQPDRAYASQWREADTTSLLLQPALLSQVAGAEGPLRFSGPQPADPAAAAHFSATLTHITDNLLSNPEAAAQPLVIGNAGRLLAASALVTFPRAVAEPSLQDTRDATPETLRRAMIFIDENAQHSLTITDIALAVRVTPRALQYAFRRHLGTTPMHYLRRVRLAHAHRDLRSAPPGTTVTTIAARWGFLHPGRFATYYREAYGQSPHEVLSN
jgi:AraC-like DNA-binding protein